MSENSFTLKLAFLQKKTWCKISFPMAYRKDNRLNLSLLAGFQDVKNVINCVGGVHALIPLLERGAQAKQSFYISGFLTLVRNFVRCHQINCEQLMRGGGVYIIGGLMQNLNPSLVNCLMNLLQKNFDIIFSTSFSPLRVFL